MKRPHYAWMVCLGSALVLFSTIGLGVNVFTIYQPEIILANGFSNAQGSWITTTRSLFILAALLTVNQLCQRLGLRLVMTLGVVLLHQRGLRSGPHRRSNVLCRTGHLYRQDSLWPGL